LNQFLSKNQTLFFLVITKLEFLFFDKDLTKHQGTNSKSTSYVKGLDIWYPNSNWYGIGCLPCYATHALNDDHLVHWVSSPLRRSLLEIGLVERWHALWLDNLVCRGPLSRFCTLGQKDFKKLIFVTKY